MAHQVIAALAVIKDVTGKQHYLYQDGLVPDGLADTAELSRLTRLGLLRKLPAPLVPTPDLEASLPPSSPDGDGDGDGDDGNDNGNGDEGQAHGPERPRQVAAVALWRTYAVEMGTPPAEANEMSKADIQARYPG